MVRLLVIMSTIVIGVYSVTAPEKCTSILSIKERECPRTTANMTVIANSKYGLVNEICRVYGEYSSCLQEDMPYLKEKCPPKFETAADLFISLYETSCVTYKEDQEAARACVTSNKQIAANIVKCVVRISVEDYKKKEEVSLCEYLMHLTSCLSAMDRCGQPDHIANYKKYVTETIEDTCKLFELYLQLD